MARASEKKTIEKIDIVIVLLSFIEGGQRSPFNFRHHRGGSELYLDLTHVPLRVVLAVRGVRETVVPDDVPEAGEGEEERHDPRHPSECDDRRQQSASAELVAPVEVSPILSGDGGTDDPQDEEEQEPDQFAAKG